MRQDEIIRLLSERQAEIQRFGVRSLALFGSVARDMAREDSDVDILVEFDGPPGFGRFMDLKFFLEDLLGRRVDLVTRKALKPRLRTRVEEEAADVPLRPDAAQAESSRLRDRGPGLAPGGTAGPGVRPNFC